MGGRGFSGSLVRVYFFIDQVEFLEFVLEKYLKIDHLLVNFRLVAARSNQQVDQLDEVHGDLIGVLESVLLQAPLNAGEHLQVSLELGQFLRF